MASSRLGQLVSCREADERAARLTITSWPNVWKPIGEAGYRLEDISLRTGIKVGVLRKLFEADWRCSLEDIAQILV